MLNIAIVGAGIISHSHIDAIQVNDSCRLVAVADINLDKAKAIGEQFGVRYYEDYRRMQEEERPDAVILNLPHYLHSEISIYFLNHKVHVLVEKPMANTSYECGKMTDAAEDNQVKLAVGHIQRFFQANQKVKELIENRTYGKLCMVTEVRNVFYFNDSRPKWFLDKKLSGGGIVMNYLAHTLDKLFYVMGGKITQVASLCNNMLDGYSVEGNAQVFLKFGDAVSANITFCGYQTPDFYETTYYFDHGAVKVKDTAQLWVSEDNKFVPLSFSEQENAFGKQLDEFIKYIRNEPSQIVTAEYGKQIIETIEKVYQN